MKFSKTFLNLSVTILFTSLIINSAPFIALAQNNPQIFDPLDITSSSLDGVGANFDDITMPQANPQYNGFIAPPNQDPIPVDAIHIQTAQQLASIGGVQSAGRYYVLDNDVDLVGEWVPIDDFRGTFDGQGHSVNNLYVLASSNRQYAGLFGQINVDGVVIKNVAINTGPNGITASISSTSMFIFVCAGGLVGYSEGGVVVENCYVKGDVSGFGSMSNSFGFVFVGGLVGYSSDDLSVVNCFVVGDIFGSSGSHAVYVGGLFGGRDGGVVVENCYVEGNVFGDASDGGFVGGLVGCSYSEGGVVVENCYVLGDVFGSMSVFGSSSIYFGTIYVGGLVGQSYGGVVVENCYVKGDVSGYVSDDPFRTMSFTANVGGLIGATNYDGDASVVNCFVAGDISGYANGVCLGGLIGFGGGVVVVDCFVVGDVSGSVSVFSYGYGYLSGGDAYVGGLVGRNDNYYGGGVVVENCYVEGDVTGDVSNDMSDDIFVVLVHVYVGGLVGYNGHYFGGGVAGVVVENCYVLGDVFGSVSVSGSGDADVSVGGLVGYSEGDVSVENCYVEGNVAGNPFVSASVFRVHIYLGGLVGYSEGGVVVENCYVKGNTSIDVPAYSFESGYVVCLGGGLVGQSGDVVLVDCFVVGDVTATGFVTGCVGGLVGRSGDAVVKYCYIMGDITSDLSNFVGGLIGQGGGVVVENCYVLGDVTTSSASSLGGLIGISGGDVSVKNCYVEGHMAIQGPSTTGSSVGGLIGRNSHYYDIAGGVVVENCYVKGDVSISAMPDSFNEICAGGLIGSIWYNDGVVVKNCYVEGNVAGYLLDDVYCRVYVGGLIGYCPSYFESGVVVENCYVLGDVTGYRPLSDSWGFVCVGGLVGSGGGVVTVKTCYIIGDVSGSGSGSSNSAACVGGLIGQSYGGVVVENCYVLGDVSGDSVNSEYYPYSAVCVVGGLVGGSGDLGVVVVNCFVVGDISGVASTGDVYVGGLVGSSHGSGGVVMENCYVIVNVFSSVFAGDLFGYSLYNDGGVDAESCYRLSTQQISGTQTSLISTPLSVEDMQRQESFIGWDFDTIWAINPEVNRGFPYLRGLSFEVPPSVHVNSVTGKAGEEITLTVSLENNPGIASYSMTMRYPDTLTYVTADQGDILTSNFYAITTTAGQVTVAATSPMGTDISTGTVLFTITFQINDALDDCIIGEFDGFSLGYYNVNLDGIEHNEQLYKYAITQPAIIVKNALYGDVNGDGVVDFLDVTRLLRYLWEVPDSSPFNVVNADVNGDGDVNFLDVTRLLRYLWEVDPSPLGPKQVAPAFLVMPFGFNKPVVKVSDEVCQVGDEVTLTVLLTDNPGITSFSLTLEYPDELVFIKAQAGDIINSNFRTSADNGVVTISATSENGADVAVGTILFTVTFKVSEETNAGCIDSIRLGFRSVAIESKGKCLAVDIV